MTWPFFSLLILRNLRCCSPSRSLNCESLSTRTSASAMDAQLGFWREVSNSRPSACSSKFYIHLLRDVCVLALTGVASSAQGALSTWGCPLLRTPPPLTGQPFSSCNALQNSLSAQPRSRSQWDDHPQRHAILEFSISYYR